MEFLKLLARTAVKIFGVGFVLFILHKSLPLALDLNLLIGKDAPEVASGLIVLLLQGK